MKIRNIELSVGLVLFILAVSGCAQSTESLVTPSLITSAPPTASLTSLPSITPLPLVSPTTTITPTMIPISTLSTEQAQAKFLRLLSDNGGCPLSCLWGIVPGKTSFRDAQAILGLLGSISDFTAFRDGVGSVSPSYIEGVLEIYTTVDFIADSDNNMVNSIAFTAEAHRPLEQGGYEDIFDSNFFGEKIGAYTLSHVLSEEGIPSSVMIATYGGRLTRGGTGGFDILLLYPEKGILANYTTQMHLIRTQVRGCPANAHVEMELYPSGQGASFFEHLKETDWAVKLNYYKPLAEVTNLSAEEFYKTFREPTDQCLETPANLWPIPEP